MTAELLDRVDALASTADDITTLIELTDGQVKELQGFVGRASRDAAEVAEWKSIRVLLRMTALLADQVRDVSEAVQATSRPTRLA